MCGMVQHMTTEKHNSAKRGRKPLGDGPMSAAERKRRSREQLRASGVREFSLKLEGLHLEYVENAAALRGSNTAEVLRDILESALDRFVGVTRRCERMLVNGATDEEAAAFMNTHLMPPLPPMPGLDASGSATEPKLAGASDELTIMGSEVK
jgi:hypothetical protein